MAFSSEKLTEYFDQFSGSVSHNSSPHGHSNYTVITNYLAGTSTSLQGLTDDHVNVYVQGLVSYLEDMEQPTENDKLLLDVLTHPHVYRYVQHAFAQWLIWNATNRNTAGAIAAAAAIFHKQRLSNDEIFFVYLHYLQFTQDDYAFLKQPDSEIKRYLFSILPKKLISNHYHGGLTWGSKWNLLYFIILDEARPESVKEYLIFGLSTAPEEVVECIIAFKEGKYISTIVDWLTDVKSADFESKFVTAVRLFEKDSQQFQRHAVDASKKYLQKFQLFNSKDKWERQLQFNLTGNERNAYVGYSAVAFHLLMLGDMSSAKELASAWFAEKVIVSFDVLQVLYHHLKEEALPFLKLGLKADASVGGIDYYRQIIDLLLKAFRPEQFIDILWDLTSSKSSALREYIAKLVAEKDKKAEHKAISLLQNKNAESRQTAALILSFFNTDTALNAVKTVLNTEPNDNARDTLLQIAAVSLPETPGEDFIREMVKAAAGRNKLSKPVESWLSEAELPPLYYRNGDQLEETTIRFLLYRMSRTKAMRSDMEAKYVIGLLDKEKAGPFAKQLMKLFIEKQAKPEYKYLMALSALVGNDETVDKIRTVTNGWIEENRLKMAEYGIGALALQGSDKALRAVELYSRKYKSKKANVGNAALQALQDAAEEQNISIHELGDRIVPDFGFQDLFRHFTVNGEEYRAFIDSNFKLAFFSEENKKLKAIPAAADKELKEEFKNTMKEVREVVKSQSLRLAYYLIIQRRWNADEWKKIYQTNPVMFIYATKILWGKYDRAGALQDCFMCLEDTSVVNFDGDEIDFEDDAIVGIVHPIQMDAAVLQNWKQKFFDMSIEPIFPQLERKVATVDEADKQKKINARFEGVETASGSIKATLEKHGWQKGATGDGGYIDHFRFQHTGDHTEAILEVEGVFVGGYAYDHEAKLGRLYFIDRKKETAKWFISAKDDKDARLISLGKVDPVFYSEVVGSILNIKMK